LGSRVQIFSPDAAEYIQPFLSCLNFNEPYDNVACRATTSYEQVVERRGAELIIRLASNIQYMKDVLDIIREVNDIDFNDSNENFINKIEQIIQSRYGSPVEIPLNSAASTINIQSNLMITKETCMETVNLFFDVLMPQHFIIMNHQPSDGNTETLAELQLQTKILKINYRIFHKTTLFGNIGPLKNIDKDVIEHLLNRLVYRGLLKKGLYLKSEKSNKYICYLKYLPYDKMEEQLLVDELNKHHLSLAEYQEIYKSSDDFPAGTELTTDGNKELKKQNIDFISKNHVHQQQLGVPLISNSSTNLDQIHNGKLLRKKNFTRYLFRIFGKISKLE
jgi:hypothetical protein